MTQWTVICNLSDDSVNLPQFMSYILGDKTSSININISNWCNFKQRTYGTTQKKIEEVLRPR